MKTTERRRLKIDFNFNFDIQNYCSNNHLIIDEITSLQIIVILILIVDVNIKSILIIKKKRR